MEPRDDPSGTRAPDPAGGSAPPSAELVAGAIRAEIVSRARVDASHVLVTVRGATVVITGTVTSAVQKHQAGRVARDTPGVEAVENRLLTVVR